MNAVCAHSCIPTILIYSEIVGYESLYEILFVQVFSN